jgi:hypothetical protein
MATASSPRTRNQKPARNGARTLSQGLQVEPLFCPANVASPFDTVTWTKRSAQINARFPRAGRSWPPTSSSANTSTAKSTRPSAKQRQATHSPRHPHHRRLGPRKDGYFATAEDGELLPRPDLALPAPARRLQLARVVQRRPLPPVRRDRFAKCNWRWDPKPRRSSSPKPLRISARLGLLHPASTTTWKTSCASPPARPCSSSSAPAPAPTSRRSARTAKSSPAAASPRARSRSCGSTTRSPPW